MLGSSVVRLGSEGFLQAKQQLFGSCHLFNDRDLGAEEESANKSKFILRRERCDGRSVDDIGTVDLSTCGLDYHAAELEITRPHPQVMQKEIATYPKAPLVHVARSPIWTTEALKFGLWQYRGNDWSGKCGSSSSDFACLQTAHSSQTIIVKLG